MTVYVVKEKVNLIRDAFTITNKDTGKAVYQIKAQSVSWGDKVSFQDTSGNELAYIKQVKVATLYPKYEIMRNDELWGELSTEAISTKKELLLDIPGPNDYKVAGDMMAWHFTVTRTETGALAGTIDKKWGFTDTYGVKIEEGEDDVAVLLITICINQIFQDD